MKKFYQSLKRQDGFTLVELMVVVAIIGLLSAVAIPNFKKYQAKSKVSEAKLQLSALYTAQTAFFSDFNMYSSCLRYMGFDPFAEAASRYYGVGFSAGIQAIVAGAQTSAVNSGLNGTDCPNDTDVDLAAAANADATWFAGGKGTGAVIIDTVAEAAANAAGAAQATCTVANLAGAAVYGTCLGTQADAANMAFQASAVGVISQDAATDATASGLVINQAKQIKVAVQGF